MRSWVVQGRRLFSSKMSLSLSASETCSAKRPNFSSRRGLWSLLDITRKTSYINLVMALEDGKRDLVIERGATKTEVREKKNKVSGTTGRMKLVGEENLEAVCGLTAGRKLTAARVFGRRKDRHRSRRSTKRGAWRHIKEMQILRQILLHTTQNKIRSKWFLKGGAAKVWI